MRNFFEMSIWFGNRAQWTHNNLYKTNSKFLRKISGYGWEGKRGGDGGGGANFFSGIHIFNVCT